MRPLDRFNALPVNTGRECRRPWRLENGAWMPRMKLFRPDSPREFPCLSAILDQAQKLARPRFYHPPPRQRLAVRRAYGAEAARKLGWWK